MQLISSSRMRTYSRLRRFRDLWDTRWNRRLLAALFLGCLQVPSFAEALAPEFSKVPGVVLNHIPASEERYVGSPSIAVLPDGTYVASHDEFGKKSQYHTAAITHVFSSKDRGVTWKEIARLEGAFWSSLFVHRGVLYLLGTTKEYGDCVIRRSDDGGHTWTTPKDANTGLLAKGGYHCAPMPVVEHRGRLWRGMEDAGVDGKWGHRFMAMMMSVPVEADLLQASSWTFSNRLARNPAWLEGTFNAWLEGNAVVTPRGDLVNILRVDNKPKGETAAVVEISKDGKKAVFRPKKGFIHFPGGTKKFAIRKDPSGPYYWTLSNPVLPEHAGLDPAKTRNAMALMRSKNLRDWEIRCIVLYHPDVAKHAFQYPDWLFDGEDLIVASRTAYEDGLGGARNAHDANFLTFHRIKGFRGLTMEDSVRGK